MNDKYKIREAVFFRRLYLDVLREFPNEHPAWQTGRALARWVGFNEDGQFNVADKLQKDSAELGATK